MTLSTPYVVWVKRKNIILKTRTRVREKEKWLVSFRNPSLSLNMRSLFIFFSFYYGTTALSVNEKSMNVENRFLFMNHEIRVQVVSADKGQTQ